MVTEKETIEKILRSRGIIDKNGKVDTLRFQKLVTEPWIHQKAKAYGLLDEAKSEPLNTVGIGIPANAPITQEVLEIPAEPKVEIKAPVEEPVEQPVEQEVNLTELPAENVDIKPVDEAALNEVPAEDPAPAEEKVEEKIEDEKLAEDEKPADEPVDEPVEDKVEDVIPAEELAHAEDPIPDAIPEEAPAKKSTKKGKK